MMPKLRTMLAAVAGIAIAATIAHAQAPALEKKDIKLGVGGAPSLYYLPLALADKLGFFKEQGLNVEINDFKGGSQALQALVGGSADVVTGAYEHTLRMQAKGQDIRAVMELGRNPGIVLGIKADRADKIKSVKDLKGAKIGVSAPGSSTNMMVWYLMAKDGLTKDDAAFIGVGTGAAAVAAIKKGEIDAISNIDPVTAKLEADKDIIVLAETRSVAGTQAVFGGPMAAASLYIKQDFIEKNPNTVQALANAFYKTLKWLEKATPEQIAENVPAEYHLGDKALYVAAVKACLECYSRTGVITEDVQKRTLAFLQQFDDEMKSAKFELSRTFDGRFAAKAAATVK